MRGFVFILLFATYLPTAFVQPFCGVLLWTWFSMMNPHRETFGYHGTLPYALIIAIFTFLSFLVSREPKRLRLDTVSVSLIVLMAAVSISTLLALSPDAAFQKWDRTIKTLAFCVLSLVLMTNKTRIHAFVWAMVLAIGYYGVKGGVFSIITGGQYRVYGPTNSFIYDNNHVALAIIMIVPLMYYLYLQSRHLWVRLGLLFSMLASLAAAVFTYSRGGFLALLAMGGVIWWRSRYKFQMAVLAAFAAVFVVMFAPEQWFARMNTIQNYEEDASANARLRIWTVALKIFAGNPVFGGGFRATYSPAVVDRYAPGEISRAVHNSHIEVLVETGLAGFIPHLLLIVASLAYCQRIMGRVRNRPDLLWARDLASMLQVSIVGYVVGGTFLSLGYYDGWYNIAITAAALSLVVQKQLASQPLVPTESGNSFSPAQSLASSTTTWRGQ